MEFKHTDYVQLMNGQLVRGKISDGPGALSVKIYFPLMAYVEGEQQDVDSKDSVTIQLDFWMGNGKREVDGKTWPYTSFEINGQNEDINDIFKKRTADTTKQILLVLNALKRKLPTSIAFPYSSEDDKELIKRQIETQILKFKQPLAVVSVVDKF